MLRRVLLLTSSSGLVESSLRRFHHENIRYAGIRDRWRRETKQGSEQRGFFVDAGRDTGQRIDGLLISYKGDDRLRGGLRALLMICQMVNGDYISIMRERHLAVNCRWDSRHGIGVATIQNNVVF